MSVALAELAGLQDQWPDTMQCDIVIERAGPLSPNLYRTRVAIDFGLMARARGEGAEALGIASDIETALRHAFTQLREQPRSAVAA